MEGNIHSYKHLLLFEKSWHFHFLIDNLYKRGIFKSSFVTLNLHCITTSYLVDKTELLYQSRISDCNYYISINPLTCRTLDGNVQVI